MRIEILTSSCALFISGVVFANCPSSLNTEHMSKCITVEGSGSNYQDWKKNEYEFNLDTRTETTPEVSTIKE